MNNWSEEEKKLLEYYRGRCDVWLCLQKIMDMDWETRKKIFQCRSLEDIIEKYTVKKVMELVEEYEEQEPMREFTEEETKAYSKALDKMYKPTGYNVFNEPCDDVVSRQAVLDVIYGQHIGGKEAVEHGLRNTYAADLREIVDEIIALPSVRPQKSGKWLPTYGNVQCSVCGGVQDGRNVGKATLYCCYCGAKMVEPQETETWHGIHAQITAPKGTFERIFNEADDDYDI